MRASEILRKLADEMDAQEGGQSSTQITNRPAVTDVEVEQPTDTQGIEGDAQVNVKTMVPPLQQKIDLMKKLAGLEHSEVGGVDSDNGPCPDCGCDPCMCDHAEQPDELAVLKQNAGIKPFVIAVADEDEPYEG